MNTFLLAELLSVVPFIVCVFLVIGLLLSMASDIKKSTKWHREWPQIDDNEFLARCSPGTDRNTALRVRRIVSEQLGVDYDRVYPEQRFVEDLGCD